MAGRLLTPPDAKGRRLPWGYVLPKTSDDLVGMGRCFAATTFLSAGNITHTPAYGCLIALGILGEVQQRNVSAQQIDNALAYREHIARTGRFLTFSSGAADHRHSHAPRSRRTRRAAHRARDQFRRGDARQDRHAHQPALMPRTSISVRFAASISQAIAPPSSCR